MSKDTIIFFVLVSLLLVVSKFLTDGAVRFFPKLFSVISSARVAWPAVFCLNLLDGLSTWLFLVRGEKTNMAVIEGNPLVRFTLEHMGNGAGLIVYKVFFCTILIILAFREFQPHERVVIVFFWFLLCVNNLVNLILIR